MKSVGGASAVSLKRLPRAGTSLNCKYLRCALPILTAADTKSSRTTTPILCALRACVISIKLISSLSSIVLYCNVPNKINYRSRFARGIYAPNYTAKPHYRRHRCTRIEAENQMNLVDIVTAIKHLVRIIFYTYRVDFIIHYRIKNNQRVMNLSN